MQTQFSREQLRDPDYVSSNQVLRTCVHCGFCTATCPTFVLLGDELDSPRGRIYLMKEMLEKGAPATAETALHIDRCLGCFACMTTCPSGVHYRNLLEHGRTYIEETYQRSWQDRALRFVLANVLPRPGLFRLSLIGARLARPFVVPLLPRQFQLTRRLRAMLALAPARLPEAATQQRIYPAVEEKRGRVALLTGCAQPVLAPEINAATIRLLTRMGIEVVVPPEVVCCGALTQHMGRHADAMAAARKTIAAWHEEIEGDGLDAVVINTSGCGTSIKDYGFTFRNEAAPWPDRAAKVSALAVDITTYLERIGYRPARPPCGLRVAYHAACSLQHGQGITAAPKTLLRMAGFAVAEPKESHLCCGSAGTYNMLQPDIAERLRERKLLAIGALNADVIATGNIGCLMQLSGTIPVVHTVQLLDYMAGGPAPPALRASLEETAA